MGSSFTVVQFTPNPKFQKYIQRVQHEASSKMTSFMYADIRDKIVKKALKKTHTKSGNPTKPYQKRLAKDGPFVWHTKNGNSNTPKYFVILAKSKMLEKDLTKTYNEVSFEKTPWSKETNWFKKMEKGGGGRAMSDAELDNYTWKYINDNLT